MADGVYEGKWSLKSDTRWKFLDWVQKQYGFLQKQLLERADDTHIMNSEVFKYWVAMGYPTTAIPTTEKPTAPATGFNIYGGVGTQPYGPPSPKPAGYEPTQEEVARAWRIQFGLEPEVATITPYQQAGLGLQQREFDWRMSQAAEAAARGDKELAWRMAESATERRSKEWVAQQTARANIYQREATSQAWARQTSEENIRQAERAKVAAEFEQWRATILSGVAPRDWVIREKARAAGNPFAVEPADIGEEYERLRQSAKTAGVELKNAKASLDAVNKRYTDDATIVDRAEVAVAQGRYDQAVAIKNYREDTLAAAEGAEGDEKISSYLGVSPAELKRVKAAGVGRPTATGGWVVGDFGTFGGVTKYPVSKPQIPQDIKRYIVGGEFGGEVQPPSGQSWSVAPYSTRERLYGYAESLGLNAADLETRIQSMYPQTPTRGARWSPRM